MEWCQFNIEYVDPLKLDPRKLYDLRKQLLPILDEHNIENFLVLNERNAVFFRVQVEEETKKKINKSLEDIVERSEGTFSKVTTERWDPERDAKTRIVGAAGRLGLRLKEGKGWRIVGRDALNELWVPAEDDLDPKIEEFAIFMTRVAGKFTRAFVEEMPRKVEDRWLLSVLIHLLLNSISLDRTEEAEARAFRYV